MNAAHNFPSLHLVDGLPQKSIGVTDRGLAYGDGLFETIRFKQRSLPLWPFHLERLGRGAKVLGFAIDTQAIEHYLEMVLEWAERRQQHDGVIKLVVTRGEGGRGYIPMQEPSLRVILTLSPHAGAIDPKVPVELRNCGYRLSHNPVLAGLKHLNRLEQVLAARSVDLSGDAHGLVFDKDGCIIETLHHNLFLVKDGQLVTPDLTQCGVAGTLRRAIMENFAPAESIPVSARQLYVEDLEAADEVFITNAVRGITPVKRWDKVTWKDTAVTHRLMSAISVHWNKFYD